MMYILFWYLFFWYFSNIILTFIVLFFMWFILNSWVLDAHSCALNLHSCVDNIHSCSLHIYCCLYSTSGDSIFYRVQDLCFFSVSHYRCLVYIFVSHRILFVILWKIFESRCGEIAGAVFMVFIGDGAIFIGCTVFLVIGTTSIGSVVTC